VFDIDAIATDLKKNLYVEIPLSLAEGRPSITLRHRKNGDTLTLRRPDGTSYHKKVSRIMIDQKIPKSKREDYWVIENSEGTILGMLPPISKDKTYINLEEKQTHVFIYQKSENIS
ncbi:MAG: tRNA lysidine(34) synthetase TilS, partial [Ruoffia tabacinasalis]